MAKENKNGNDFERAIQLFTEAITLLYILFNSLILDKPQTKLKHHMRNFTQREVMPICKLGNIREHSMTSQQQ